MEGFDRASAYVGMLYRVDHDGCFESCGESVQPLQSVNLFEQPSPRSWTTSEATLLLRLISFWNTEIWEWSWQTDNDGYHLMVQVKTWQMFWLDLNRMKIGFPQINPSPQATISALHLYFLYFMRWFASTFKSTHWHCPWLSTWPDSEENYQDEGFEDVYENQDRLPVSCACRVEGMMAWVRSVIPLPFDVM